MIIGVYRLSQYHASRSIIDEIYCVPEYKSVQMTVAQLAFVTMSHTMRKKINQKRSKRKGGSGECAACNATNK